MKSLQSSETLDVRVNLEVIDNELESPHRGALCKAFILHSVGGIDFNETNPAGIGDLLPTADHATVSNSIGTSRSCLVRFESVMDGAPHGSRAFLVSRLSEISCIRTTRLDAAGRTPIESVSRGIHLDSRDGASDAPV